MPGRVDGRTALIAAACIGLVLAPLGVEAATDNVVIKDADSNKRADVSGGELHVGDGNGPLTVNGNLDVSTRPDTERVLPGASSDRFVQAGGIMTDTPVALTNALAGDQQLRVSSITVANSSAASADVVIEAVAPDDPSNCTGAGSLRARVARVIVGPRETVHLTYPHPIVVNEVEATDYCVNASRGNRNEPSAVEDVFIALNGYMIVL
jgi:hypothetical protein